uniref:Coatomer alpha subunit C-terminal domain-containing protein n=1 Tax=Meloidogyne enterolobii TaxID=390850 RepID=A0A6V7VGB8_MELEN|nr:unnamed protein product [Meloidogyne enterolobii]
MFSFLRELGQISLAYLSATTHGLTEEASQLTLELENKNIPVPDANPNAKPFVPPKPLYPLTENWPQLTVSVGPFDTQLLSNTTTKKAPTAKTPALNAFAAEQNEDHTEGEAWGVDGDLLLDEEGNPEMDEIEMIGGEEDEEGGWDVDEEITQAVESMRIGAGDEAADDGFTLPQRGHAPPFYWPGNSRLTADHVAAGAFDSAARLLEESLGIVQIGPFKSLFLSTYAKSRVACCAMPLSPPNFIYPMRNWQESLPKSSLPAVSLKLNDLAQRLQICYKLTTDGKFVESVQRFRQILLCIPLLVVDSKQEVLEAQQLLQICREYLVGLLLETARKDLPRESTEDAKRNLEMAAYFTNCDIQPIHKILTLRTAANLSFKNKQMRHCATFCRRCIELGPKPEVAAQMRKMLSVAERDNTNAYEINYDEHNPFVLCSKSFTPLYRGKPQVKCPFCGASYMPTFVGSVCDVCEVAEIGRDVPGLRIASIQSGK